MPPLGYLHKDGVWRPLGDLGMKDAQGNWSAYYTNDEIGIG